MAYLLSGERPVAAVTTNPVTGLFRWLARTRAARRQRLALSQLLELDSALLYDLGITRQDVYAAMRKGNGAGEALARRRAECARNWLDR